MKKLIIFISLSICFGSPVFASPSCSRILVPENLERKHQYLAPIYNSSTTGWIFAKNQLQDIRRLKEVEKTLLKKIVTNLAQRGTQLAILMPPPRPVIAGQEIVDETLGHKGKYDVTKQLVAFQSLNKQIADLGIVIPDLSKVMSSNSNVIEQFYFKRDPHWTNKGAAYSAIYLAEALGVSSNYSFKPENLQIVKTYAETSSYQKIFAKYCGQKLQPEASFLLDYYSLVNSPGLLSTENVNEANTVLLGTSFSNRKDQDQYQVAEAISAALQRPIENRSIVGGGLAGAFEVYFLSGEFAANKPSLLIWEFPSTTEFNESILRQVLGVIRQSDRGEKNVIPIEINSEITTIDLPLKLPPTEPLGLRMTDGRARDITLRLKSDVGEKLKFRVKRNPRVAGIEGLDTWWFDVSDLPGSVIDILIKPNKQNDLKEVELLTVEAME